MTSLYWFDRLARNGIDQALQEIQTENADAHLGYVVTASVGSNPGRDRCILNVDPTSMNKPLSSGSFIVRSVAPNHVRIEQSFKFFDGGKVSVLADFVGGDVTKADVLQFARPFIEEFFLQVP